MIVIQREVLQRALENKKKGTLREAFPGEEPDLVLSRDKECTSLTIIRNGMGFSVEFPVPIFLMAGSKYVFEEDVE